MAQTVRPMTNREKYDASFREAFELEDQVKLEDLRYQSIEEWDSIGHMGLMSELEDKFNITIKTEDLVEFESYNQGVTILKRYGVDV